MGAKVVGGFLEEIQAAMEVLDEPKAVENGDGTSVVTDSTGFCSEDMDTESLDEFLSYARYGNEVQFGSFRHNRDFIVKNGRLFVLQK